MVQTTRELLMAYVAEQTGALQHHAPGVRSGEPEAVHKTRVAMRRLRSALATYRPVLDRSLTDPIRADVRDLAGELGPARDLEVLRGRLMKLIDDEVEGGGRERVRTTVDDWLAPRRRTAGERAAAAVSDGRLSELIDHLDVVVLAGDEPASDLVGGLLRHDWHRLEKAAHKALAAPPDDDRHALLHDARKAAKRVRYAAESATPVLGSKARRLAKRAERMQTDLGAHQDALVVREALRKVAACADSEVAFALGHLHAVEQMRSDRADRTFAERWAKQSARYPRPWMT